MKHRLFIVLSGRCFSHQKRRKWSFRLVHVCDRKLRMLSEAPNISSAVQDSRCERPCYLQACRGSCSGRAVAVPARRVEMHIQPWTDPCNTRQRLFSSFSLTWFILFGTKMVQLLPTCSLRDLIVEVWRDVAVSVNCLSQIPTASASKIGSTFQI